MEAGSVEVNVATGHSDASNPLLSMSVDYPTDAASTITFPVQSLLSSPSLPTNPSLHQDSVNPHPLHVTSHDLHVHGASSKASIQQQRTARWQADASNHTSSGNRPASQSPTPHQSSPEAKQEPNELECEDVEGTLSFGYIPTA